MKTVEELNEFYEKLVKRFLPDKVHLAEQVGQEIELFFAENEQFGEQQISNLRLKMEGDVFSENLYDIVRLESAVNGTKFGQEDDIYLYIRGESNISFGFDYCAKHKNKP